MQRPTRSEKKKVKRERIQEKYANAKAAKKEAQKLKKANLPEIEPVTSLSMRSERTRMDREEFICRSQQNPTILIDCDFADFMEPREITSMTQQILQCYGIIKRLIRPPRLALCGVSDAQADLIRVLPGISKWYFKTTSDILGEGVWPVTSDLIYLSADADSDLDLTTINRDTVLIVGGLVDRNRYKGLTNDKARDLKVRTARLPISSFVEMSASKVLTVNQVVEILAEALNAGEWASALKRIIPDRKLVS